MLAAHLSLAGMAEMVIGGALVAYLQRADPGCCAAPRRARRRMSRSRRKRRAGTAAAALDRPGGVDAGHAAGPAGHGLRLGRMGPGGFENPAVRQQIAACFEQCRAARRPCPPGWRSSPRVWTAPMPDYAPTFLKSEKLGYICSAMFGTGLILAAWLLLGGIIRLAPDRLPSERRPS